LDAAAHHCVAGLTAKLPKDCMKPIHKRIGSRVWKYQRHFTKYLYERDTIFATLWVFAFIILLALIPINFYFLNPLKLALKDFDFNDITYAKLGKSANTPIDNRIVVINIGYADREGLAHLLDKTAAAQPKVMGLDVVFEGPKDPISDSIIMAAFMKHRNLVVTNRIDWEDTAEYLKGQFFTDFTALKGYGNLIGDSKEERRTIRMFSPFETIKKDTLPSFATAILREYDATAYERLKKRRKETEIINYARHTNQYHIIEAEDLLQDRVADTAIKGKIALLGYINESPYDIEDKVFSPMNEHFAGKSTPDMNGIIVHANIISMVLDNNYIKKLPSWVTWLVAILICWLHMSFFIRYYLENHIWFHLVAKIAQLASAIIFAYLGILLFDRYNLKLDMKLSLIVIVMAVDVIYFYEAFAVWMHKKFHYQTLFHHKHH
jgi:CHASE2 domain-containing sensor protein